jgi:Transposase
VTLPRKGEQEVIFLGIDWAEAHHDLCLLSETGSVLARERVSNDAAGVARLHEIVAEHASDTGEVAVGIELDRGLLVEALGSAGYQLYAINPLSVDRYRDRHRSRAPSRTPAMPRSSPTSFAPTGTTIDRSPVTPSWPTRSRCSPGRTRI